MTSNCPPIFALALAAFATSLASATARADDRAMTVELTRPGFALVSDVVKDQFLTTLTAAALPDEEISIPLVANVIASGITYSVRLKSLDAYPTNGAIGFDALIDDIEVNVRGVRFESWLLPLVGSTCTNAVIHIGNGNDLPVSALLDASVANDKLALKVHALDFNLARSQYQSSGPDECRGLFDIKDYFTRFVVRAVLANARPAIELGVQVAARLVVPTIAAQLNKLATSPMIIDLPSLLVVPATSVKISGHPTSLVLTGSSMKVALSAKVDRVHGLPPAADAPQTARHAALPNTVYGTFGFDPRFMTEAMAAFLADGSLPLELTPDMDPMIDAITQRDSLTAFWPDLTVAQGIDARLKVFASVGQAPVLTALADGSGWHLSAPDLQLQYKALRAGAWIDYATIHIKAEVDVAPQVVDGQIIMKVLGGTAATTAAWAPTYTPVDPMFDQATADQVFLAAIQLSASSDTPPHFALPILPLAGHHLSLDALRQENGYTEFNLIEAPAP